MWRGIGRRGNNTTSGRGKIGSSLTASDEGKAMGEVVGKSLWADAITLAHFPWRERTLRPLN